MLKGPQKSQFCTGKPVGKTVDPMSPIRRSEGRVEVRGAFLFMVRSLPTFLSTSHAASGRRFFKSRSIFSIECRKAESLLTRREIRL